jgi:hypothetical protein
MSTCKMMQTFNFVHYQKMNILKNIVFLTWVVWQDNETVMHTSIYDILAASAARGDSPQNHVYVRFMFVFVII